MDQTSTSDTANDCTAKVPVEPMKHMNLVGSMRRLNEVKSVLYSLLVRIRGNVPSSDPDNTEDHFMSRENPPLSIVLNDAPNYIATTAEEIINRINEIEDQLF